MSPSFRQNMGKKIIQTERQTGCLQIDSHSAMTSQLFVCLSYSTSHSVNKYVVQSVIAISAEKVQCETYTSFDNQILVEGKQFAFHCMNQFVAPKTRSK